MTDKERDEAIIDIQKRLKALEVDVANIKQNANKPVNIDAGSLWPEKQQKVDGGEWK